MSENYKDLATKFEGEPDGVRDASGELILLLRTPWGSDILDLSLETKNISSGSRHFTSRYHTLREQIPPRYTSAFLFKHFCTSQLSEE